MIFVSRNVIFDGDSRDCHGDSGKFEVSRPIEDKGNKIMEENGPSQESRIS